ncbi:hypothetical protein BD410DRAFT_808434 [Rickenella mellea]|uniref:Uncharacterized protein n=1 Tax=Rickenella mellea TaxID=50990 RepID=A0A4Y7PKP8_9AGAM|nr:hypothetical protein BD410DRAFT_808434 [Rickenella mellea]
MSWELSATAATLSLSSLAVAHARLSRNLRQYECPPGTLESLWHLFVRNTDSFTAISELANSNTHDRLISPAMSASFGRILRGAHAKDRYCSQTVRRPRWDTGAGQGRSSNDHSSALYPLDSSGIRRVSRLPMNVGGMHGEARGQECPLLVKNLGAFGSRGEELREAWHLLHLRCSDFVRG